MSDSPTVPTLEYLENRFYPDDGFLAYNATRCIQEKEKYEILSRYLGIGTDLAQEFETLTKSEYEKFVSETKKIQTLNAMLDNGMTVLTSFTDHSLSEIAQRLIFKYTSHDEIMVGDVVHRLFANPSARYDELYDDFWATLERGVIQQDNMSRAVQDKQAAMRQRPMSHVSGGGVGFKGVVYRAIGASMTNIGLGLLQGISDGLEYSSDNSKVKRAEAVGVDRARNDIIYMGQEQRNYALAFCQEILMSDMQRELDTLGIVPYKTYSAQDTERRELRNENYDEAYREHDIDEARYTSNIFRAIAEDPYDVSQYANLYLVAICIGSEALKEKIMSFATFLGIDKTLDLEMDRKSSVQISSYRSVPEQTMEDVKQKIRLIAPLYGESAKREIDRLNDILGNFEIIEKMQKVVGGFQRNISAGHRITAYIRPNRTVAVIGTNEGGSLKVNHFKNIIAISARSELTIGLCSDGTVVSSGSLTNKAKVQNWTDITGISMGGVHCAGVKKDGTVVCAKVSGFNDNIDYGQLDVSSWHDIASVVCGTYYTVGVKKDGTVVFTGRFGPQGVGLPLSQEDLKELAGWTNISTVAAGTSHILGLRKDGTVVAVGSNTYQQCEVRSWNGVVAIAAGYEHSIGLRHDGTLYSTGNNEHDQCKVAKWRDIIAVATTADHTVGMKKDATLVSTGPVYDRCVQLQGAVVCVQN